MEFSPEQDAILSLRSWQTSLEYYRNEGYPDDEGYLFLEDDNPSCQVELSLLGLTKQAGSDPLKWLMSVDSIRCLERLAIALLPYDVVTLTDNDRGLLLLMRKTNATNPANAKPASLLMDGIGGGDHKKAFNRLKQGGYVLSAKGRSGGMYLSRLGNQTAEQLA